MTDHGRVLLELARKAIETSLDGSDVTVPAAPWLQAPAGVFVSLHRRADDALRGCIGSIEPRLPLGRALVSAARSAAFHDPRFGPLSRAELASVRLEVSVLSPLTPLAVSSEADASAQLEQTKPGVVLCYGRHRGVLLPKVWSSIPHGADFIQQLKLKADLSPRFWSKDIELQVFSCEEFAETDEMASREAAS